MDHPSTISEAFADWARWRLALEQGRPKAGFYVGAAERAIAATPARSPGDWAAKVIVGLINAPDPVIPPETKGLHK